MMQRPSTVIGNESDKRSTIKEKIGAKERRLTMKISNSIMADLERAKAAIARADVIAGCVRATRGKGPAELERALLAAGIDAITADAIARFGWRDPRTALRRAVVKLQRRLAGLERFAARDAGVSP